jgi:hypothetical protein
MVEQRRRGYIILERQGYREGRIGADAGAGVTVSTQSMKGEGAPLTAESSDRASQINI